MSLLLLADKVKSKKDFLLFLINLRKDFEKRGTEWENSDLEFFLNGLQGYCKDAEIERLSWKELAHILLAARVYE